MFSEKFQNNTTWFDILSNQNFTILDINFKRGKCFLKPLNVMTEHA